MAWVIDPTHTQVEFAVKHMMITTVRGSFGAFTGTLNLDEANPANSSVEGSIDVTSLNTREAQRDAHLRGTDFFDVENYPTITFRSTKVEPKGGDRYKVYGDLTIRGITREVVLDVTDEGKGKDPWGNQRRAFSINGNLNRKDFGLTWNVALETGGWLVGEEVKLFIEAQTIHQPEAVPASA